MPGKAAKIVITERQQLLLEEMASARCIQVRLAERAAIILLAFEGLQNQEIASIVGINRDQVGLWRRRWQGAFERLVAVECSESLDRLRKEIVSLLSDRHRSGRPPRITSEQQAKLISLACEDPGQSNRPIACWTSRELANEAVRREILDAISARWCRHLLARCKLRPHRNKYWLFSPDKYDEDFEQRVATICQIYREAIELHQQRGVHTVCIDEQTGIQALERIALDLLPEPGRVAKREFEYKRHGTIGLFGNFHVATGRILSPLLRETRTEEDFLENLDGLLAHDRKGAWRIVVDNLNTHYSESCVRYIAAIHDYDGDLGRKGARGILKSTTTRKAFLSDPNHRVRFIYLPRHTSWLNQIEIWFGVLRRKLTRLGSFASVTELTDKIIEFIDYYNSNLAKPYKWTYTGRVACE